MFSKSRTWVKSKYNRSMGAVRAEYATWDLETKVRNGVLTLIAMLVAVAVALASFGVGTDTSSASAANVVTSTPSTTATTTPASKSTARETSSSTSPTSTATPSVVVTSISAANADARAVADRKDAEVAAKKVADAVKATAARVNQVLVADAGNVVKATAAKMKAIAGSDKIVVADMKGILYPDAFRAPLLKSQRTPKGVQQVIRSEYKAAAGYGLVLNHLFAQGGNNPADVDPALANFATSHQANTWIDSCKASMSANCKATANTVAKLWSSFDYLGVRRASSTFNVNTAGLGLSPDHVAVNPVQETGQFMVSQRNTKTGPVCIGVNIGVNSVNGGDARPAIITCGVKHVAHKATVSHVRHVVVPRHVNPRVVTRTNVVSTPRYITKVVKVPVTRTITRTHVITKTKIVKIKVPCPKKPKPCVEPWYANHPGYKSLGNCRWTKIPQSHAVKRDGGTAGGKQTVGNNNTSGVATGPTKTSNGTPVTEPTKPPTNTSSTPPVNTGTGHAGSGTGNGGVTPGGSSTIGGSTSTGSGQSTAPGANSGQGGDNATPIVGGL